MEPSSAIVLVLGVAVLLLPLLTSYYPQQAGRIGVLALTAASVFFFTMGKSAMTETTAAILAVGAFLLAAIIGLHHSMERRDE